MKNSVFLQLLILRVSSAFLVQSSFVPDEYWQSLEVAHRIVFGYGYLTWEWTLGIRSSITILPVLVIFKILSWFKIDYPVLLILLPRIAYSAITALGDYAIYRSSKLHYGPKCAYYTYICLSTSWFLYYCSSRTLVNNLEQVLVSFGWYFYSRKKFDDSYPNIYLIFVICIGVAMRPTSAIILGPLWLLNGWKNETNLQKYLLRSVISGIFILISSVLLDLMVYEKFLLTPVAFLEFNVFTDGSSAFGTHPWHWYLSQGVPTTMLTHLIFVYTMIVDVKNQATRSITWMFFLYLVGYSCISHKEIRFLLPILPLLCSLGGRFLSTISPRNGMKWVTCLWVVNIPLVLYLGLVHQRGPLDVVNYLRSECLKRVDAGYSCSIFQLTPCHSTPHLSHIHLDIEMSFLTCKPNFEKNLTYIDEADLFYMDVELWIKDQQGLSADYLVMFDELNERVEPNFWKKLGYTLDKSFFHTHFPTGRQGSHMLVYKSTSRE